MLIFLLLVRYYIWSMWWAQFLIFIWDCVIQISNSAEIHKYKRADIKNWVDWVLVFLTLWPADDISLLFSSWFIIATIFVNFWDTVFIFWVCGCQKIFFQKYGAVLSTRVIRNWLYINRVSKWAQSPRYLFSQAMKEWGRTMPKALDHSEPG